MTGARATQIRKLLTVPGDSIPKWCVGELLEEVDRLKRRLMTFEAFQKVAPQEIPRRQAPEKKTAPTKTKTRKAKKRSPKTKKTYKGKK